MNEEAYKEEQVECIAQAGVGSLKSGQERRTCILKVVYFKCNS